MCIVFVVYNVPVGLGDLDNAHVILVALARLGLKVEDARLVEFALIRVAQGGECELLGRAIEAVVRVAVLGLVDRVSDGQLRPYPLDGGALVYLDDLGHEAVVRDEYARRLLGHNGDAQHGRIGRMVEQLEQVLAHVLQRNRVLLVEVGGLVAADDRPTLAIAVLGHNLHELHALQRLAVLRLVLLVLDGLVFVTSFAVIIGVCFAAVVVVRCFVYVHFALVF